LRFHGWAGQYLGTAARRSKQYLGEQLNLEKVISGLQEELQRVKQRITFLERQVRRKPSKPRKRTAQVGGTKVVAINRKSGAPRRRAS